jgi:hypothetical protein
MERVLGRKGVSGSVRPCGCSVLLHTRVCSFAFSPPFLLLDFKLRCPQHPYGTVASAKVVPSQDSMRDGGEYNILSFLDRNVVRSKRSTFHVSMLSLVVL